MAPLFGFVHVRFFHGLFVSVMCRTGKNIADLKLLAAR